MTLNPPRGNAPKCAAKLIRPKCHKKICLVKWPRPRLRAKPNVRRPRSTWNPRQRNPLLPQIMSLTLPSVTL